MDRILKSENFGTSFYNLKTHVSRSSIPQLRKSTQTTLEQYQGPAVRKKFDSLQVGNLAYLFRNSTRFQIVSLQNSWS